MADPNRQLPQNPRSQGPSPAGGPPRKPGQFTLVWLLVLAAIFLFISMRMQGGPRRDITLSQFSDYVASGQLVEKIDAYAGRIEGQNPEGMPGLEPKAPAKFRVQFPVNQEYLVQLEKDLAANAPGVQLEFHPASAWAQWLPQIILTVAVIAFLYFMVIRRMGGGGGGGFMGGFGRSKHKVINKEQAKVTFSDVAGIDEAKEEVTEIIEFLRNPKKFERLGGRIPRGVLLVGLPGCGKTLMAKAIAGEADVPVFVISGSDFVELFAGIGASRVRSLFQQARQSAPCIIFVDEIDAIGRRRGEASHGGGAQDEREQTLNAILVEMDGLGTSDQVIVVGATNRMDVLDPALTRPGRFDRQIDVPLPDLKGREQILSIYAKRIHLAPEVDLHRVARGTPMFSGADLEALVNEAAIAATMHGKDHVELADLEEARDKVRWGRARKSRVVDEKERRITAYHEAGHALVQVVEENADPLHKVSIIPRGMAGGATFSLPEQDRYFYTKRYCEAQLSVCLAGRLAEELFCGDVSSGAAADIGMATDIAKRMVIDWGMSDRLGMINFGGDSGQRAMMGYFTMRDYSERTAEVIDAEIKRIVDEMYDATRKLIMEHREQVEAIAQALLIHETLDANEVKAIIRGEELDKPVKTTVDDLLAQEQAKAPEPELPDEPIYDAEGSHDGDDA
jgi:cell division protease FtsH